MNLLRIIPPSYVKPYVRRGKNDAADAEAICEVVSRPSMRFVPVKSEDQQAALMQHKARELSMRQQNMLVNALRSHMAEMVLIAALAKSRPSVLTFICGWLLIVFAQLINALWHIDASL